MSEEKRLIQSVEVTEAGIHVLQLQGVLDASTVAELEEVVGYLLSQKHSRFVMDLTNVNFISSAGWGVFIGELKKIRNSSGDIKLSGMQPEVLDVFMLLELDHLIEAHPTVDEAIASFLKNMPAAAKAADRKSVSDSGDELEAESPAPPPAEEEPDPDEIAEERPVDLLETMDNDELEEYEEDFLKLFGDQLPEDEPEDLSLPVEEEPAEDDGDAEDVDELDALEALEKLKKMAAEEHQQKKSEREEAEPASSEAASPTVVKASAPALESEPQPVAEDAPAPKPSPQAAEPSTAEVEAAALKQSPKRPKKQERPSDAKRAAAGSSQSQPVKKKAPETPPDAFSLDNPFDIADTSDPWLGSVDLDYNQGWEAATGDAGASGDYSQLLTGEYLDAESAINVDGWMTSSLEEGVFEWGDSDNGGTAVGGGDVEAKSPASDSESGEELREHVRGVVVEFPDYGPSAIRKHLLTKKLIDSNVTRSMIYRTLVELDLDTRSKRLAFSAAQKK